MDLGGVYFAHSDQGVGLPSAVSAIVSPVSPQLSVCCMTKDPPSQVVAILEQFRPVADEIVVAVDSRLPIDEVQRFGHIADRLVRFEYAPPAERSFAWLYSLCSGDWIFRVDGDEVPSSELVHVLPELVRRREVFHYLFPRRWVYPDGRHWLAESRWWPDFQDRLVRNDPAILRVKGEVHSSFHLRAPVRYIDTPFYHLDCVLNSVENRRAKIQSYEVLRPRSTIRSANDLYLPEEYAHKPPRAIPDTDVERILRVLRPGAAPEPLDREVEFVPLTVVDQHWKLRPVADEEYDGSVSCWQDDVDVRAGEPTTVFVEVRNTGSFSWDDCPPTVQIGYRWFTAEGDAINGPILRSLLPCRLSPGDRTIVPIEVTGPVGGGRHLLEFVLIHDEHRWFGQPGRIILDVDSNASDDRAEWFRRREVDLQRELVAATARLEALAQRRAVRWSDRLAGLRRAILKALRA